MTTVAIVQARVTSSRLPGKILRPILGEPMLAHQLRRVRRSRTLDRIIVATSTGVADDAVASLCAELDTECYRGDLNDVLDRFHGAAVNAGLGSGDHIVRLTADCPLTDSRVIDLVVDFYQLQSALDYAGNAAQPTYPDGLDVEIFRLEALERAWREARLPSQREHVTPYIHGRPDIFHVAHYKGPRDWSHLRWTVDEPADLEFVTRVYEHLYPSNPQFGMEDVLELLERHPELNNINQQFERNEGLRMSVTKDRFQQRYGRSAELLDRALRTIPLGSQTFSKSVTQYPAGVSPHFICRGQGSRVWDVDGNEYVDYVNSLAAINLGYNDPDVTAAVHEQLKEGVVFSLSHPIEMQVAEKLREMVPCAEMTRFGKNGSDATAGAIRLARAYTGRDHVLVCGYHGWQDWYIGSTARNRGVPQAVRGLTHSFVYNDIDAVDQLFRRFPGQVAAVILEPMNVVQPNPGYLEELKEITHRNGALLVFDETITGFRYAAGGAQARFGVTPDLATFGKGMANGYPVSALSGSADVMKLMEEIFFSFTFGGEALSLAAALATMVKIQKAPVIETLYEQGEKVVRGVEGLIGKHDVGHLLSIRGNPTWSFLIFADAGGYSQWEVKTLFLQEVLLRGVMTLGTHNMSFAHGEAEILHLLKTYDEVFPLLKRAVDEKAMSRLLATRPLQPLFKVR